MGQAPQTAGRKEEEEEEKETTPAVGVFLDAFAFLQSSRYPSMGEFMLPIPADAILAYCNTFGWTGADRYLLIEVVRALDMACMEHFNKRGRGKLNANKNKSQKKAT